MEAIYERTPRRTLSRLAVIGTILVSLLAGGITLAEEADASVTQHSSVAHCQITGYGNRIRVVDSIYATKAWDFEWTRVVIWARPESGGSWQRYVDTGWRKMWASTAGWNALDWYVYAPHGYQYQVQVLHGSIGGDHRVAQSYSMSLNGVPAGGLFQSPDYCSL